MPLYEYKCDACGATFEVIQKFSDPPPETCQKCGKGPVQKQVSSPAFQFKGSGWYITDYARKSGDGGSSKSGESSGESAPAKEKKDKPESKPAEKPATPAAKDS